MTYSIPRTTFKDMSLTCDPDYQALLTEVKKKPVPETVTIYMVELKVCLGFNASTG
jgi:hypothetical protein